MLEKHSIVDLLAQNVVVFDGAMGTEIYRRNVFTNRCYDELNLTDPEIIRAIHVDYCNAGADVLTTNTFGANRPALAKYGLAERLADINRAAVALAREVVDAAKDRVVLVAGSVGPVSLETREEEECIGVMAEQVGALIEAGVDFVMFETQPTRRALERCAKAMGAHRDFPFVLSCTVFADCESVAGEPLSRIFAELPEGLPRPAAWGMNCGVGPDALLTAAEKAVKVVDGPLIVIPNAGTPKEVGGRQLYLCSPDYIAEYAKRYLDLGVRGIGGCCGTTPDHIREIATRIKPLARSAGKAFRVEFEESVEPQEPMPFPEKSRLAWRLANRKWVATVELVPPRGCSIRDTVLKARELHRQGVDAINLPDGPRASSRLSPLVTALYIQREAQIEAILHFCCRDRNLIGMQADLLACALAEIRNILFVTGDPPKLGNYPNASGVFDVDSIGMCEVQKHLNQGIDLGGQAINPKTDAVIGVGADPSALDQDREVDRFEKKVKAGAEFAITQPVFDVDALNCFLDRVEDCQIPVLAGIWPLASLRNATFLQNEVPGVTIPQEIMERMASFPDRDDQRAAGIEIAREAVERIRPRIAGIQVSAPFGNIQTALAVIED